MLTSFFGKSSPVNYLLACLFIFFAYLIYTVLKFQGEITPLFIGEHLLRVVLLVFSVLLLDFMIRKNALTLSNTYGIFLFSCFLVGIPAVFASTPLVVANTFVLLAMRRIFSLHTNFNNEKKILDAAIWITVASFFYYWSLLFFPVLIYATVRKEGFRFRHLFIPVLGSATALIIYTAIYALATDSFQWTANWLQQIGYDFTPYSQMELLLVATLFGTFLIWAGLYIMRTISTVPKKLKPLKYLLLVTAAFAILAAIAAPVKTGGELIFSIGPLAIVMANYIERLEEFWFKELLLWVVLLLPIGLITASLV